MPGFPKNRFWCLCHGHPMGDRAHFPLGCTQVKYLLPFVHALCLYVSPFMSLGVIRYSPDIPTFTHFTSGILPLRKVLKTAAMGIAEVHEQVCKTADKYSSQVSKQPLPLLQKGILGKQEHSPNTDVSKIPIQTERKLTAQKQLH